MASKIVQFNADVKIMVNVQSKYIHILCIILLSCICAFYRIISHFPHSSICYRKNERECSVYTTHNSEHYNTYAS